MSDSRARAASRLLEVRFSTTSWAELKLGSDSYIQPRRHNMSTFFAACCISLSCNWNSQQMYSCPVNGPATFISFPYGMCMAFHRNYADELNTFKCPMVWECFLRHFAFISSMFSASFVLHMHSNQSLLMIGQNRKGKRICLVKVLSLTYRFCILNTWRICL